MTFLNAQVRQTFHELTLDRQRELIAFEESLAKRGKSLHILYVEIIDSKTSEISVRITCEGDEAA